MTNLNDTKNTKTSVVIEATFNANGMNTPEFKEYSRRSNANGEAHGGVVISKFQVTGQLASNGMESTLPHLILVIEYPNQESAEKTFSNQEYLSIIPLRDVAFKSVKIYQTNSLSV